VTVEGAEKDHLIAQRCIEQLRDLRDQQAERKK
jgi:hypothetical protein